MAATSAGKKKQSVAAYSLVDSIDRIGVLEFLGEHLRECEDQANQRYAHAQHDAARCAAGGESQAFSEVRRLVLRLIRSVKYSDRRRLQAERAK